MDPAFLFFLIGSSLAGTVIPLGLEQWFGQATVPGNKLAFQTLIGFGNVLQLSMRKSIKNDMTRNLLVGAGIGWVVNWMISRERGSPGKALYNMIVYALVYSVVIHAANQALPGVKALKSDTANIYQEIRKTLSGTEKYMKMK